VGHKPKGEKVQVERSIHGRLQNRLLSQGSVKGVVVVALVITHTTIICGPWSAPGQG
jgi:hypothetical protein